MKQQRYKSKFFPFSPGIPWKIERGKYIIPEIDFETWHKALDKREVIITAFGGMIESFFSLCAAEALACINPVKVSWIGNQEFSFFLRLQGLCKPSAIRLTPDLLRQYPVPLFLDNGGNAYLNILNNYLSRSSYWGKYQEEVKAPIFEQMARNIMIPWNNYVPKLRNLGNDLMDELYRAGRLRTNSRIISIILSDTNKSLLQWTLPNLKEFAQLASHKGWKVIVFNKKPNLVYGQNILAAEYNNKSILQAIKKSWVVLSSDINWLLISLMISDAKLISSNIDNQYSLLKNAEFLGVSNDIFTQRNISTIDVLNICEGL